MRIGIVSDTHGHKAFLQRAIAAIGPVDVYIHLGDGVRDARLLEETGKPVYCVSGNRDDPDSAPEELVIELGGTTFLLTHGDRYRVGFTLDRIAYRAMEAGAGIALYGHTHRKAHERIQGIDIYNPGSVGQPRDGAAGALVLDGDDSAGWTPLRVDLSNR